MNPNLALSFKGAPHCSNKQQEASLRGVTKDLPSRDLLFILDSMARKGVRALWLKIYDVGNFRGLWSKDTNWQQRVGWSWIGKNCLGLSQEFHVNGRRVGCQLKSGISSDFMPCIFQNCLDSQHWMLSTCPVSFWFGFLALKCIKHLSIQYTWVVSKSQTPATKHTCKDLTSQWEDLCCTFERNTFEQIRCFYLYIYMYIILYIYIYITR